MTKKVYIFFLVFFSAFVLKSQNAENNLYQKVLALYAQKQYEDAISVFNNSKFDNFSDAELNIAAGDCYYKLQQYDEAINLYSKALKLKNKEAFLKIAECYAQEGYAYKATEYLKNYLKTPDKLLKSQIKLLPAFQKIENEKVWANIWKQKYYNSYENKLDEAKYQISKNDYAAAFDILDKLIIKNRKRHRAYEMRGDLLMLTKDYKNAAISYLKASEIKKHNLTYKTKVADVLFLIRKYKKAEKLYNEIVADKHYNPEILLKKAKNDIELKKYSEASNAVSQFLNYFPDNAEAFFISGKILALNNENIAALENYNKAIKNDSSKPEYFISCGDTYLKTKTFESAVSSYSMALDLNPRISEAWYKKGVAEIKLYKYAEACEDLKKAKSMNYNKADDLIFKYCK